MRKIKKITVEYDDGTIDVQDTGLPDKPIDLTRPWPHGLNNDYTAPPVQDDEFCAIREYFKKYPNETSVMMTCSCRRCSTWCNTSTNII